MNRPINQQQLPRLTMRDIEALEAVYPPRCLRPGESVESHLRYAGKVDLILVLKSLVDPGMEFTPDEEEAMDAMAAEIANQQLGDS